MGYQVAALAPLGNDLGQSIYTLGESLPWVSIHSLWRIRVAPLLKTSYIGNSRPVDISGRPSRVQQSTGPSTAVDHFIKDWQDVFLCLDWSIINSTSGRPLADPVDFFFLDVAVDHAQTSGPPILFSWNDLSILLAAVDHSQSGGRPLGKLFTNFKSNQIESNTITHQV